MKTLLLGLALGIVPLSASAGHRDHAPSHRGHGDVSIDFRYTRHESPSHPHNRGYDHRDRHHHGHAGAVIGRHGPLHSYGHDAHAHYRPRPTYGTYCPPPPPVYCPPVYRIQPYPPICR